ncbi:hypothetical protein [uncultured Roseibium sp.]|uniref:hypothetical protein n=1 Tax=uncultured Roseibium sp. TaxID=1936171 RepID=UPI00262E8508|nr:hypothetical protein [uncultured Roseibium sp.]
MAEYRRKWASVDQLARMILEQAIGKQKPVLLSPETAVLVADRMLITDSDPFVRGLHFRVETWDREGKQPLELLVATQKISIGHDAFRTVMIDSPEDRTLLRHGIRVLRDSASEPEAGSD